MRSCPSCGGDVPEVQGADEQACPACGTRFAAGGPGAGAARSRGASPAGIEAGALVGRTLSAWASNLPQLALHWAPAALASAAATFLFVASYGERFEAVQRAPEAVPPAQLLEILGALTGISLVQGFVTMFFLGGTVVLARAIREGAPVRATAAWGQAFRRFAPLAGTSVVVWTLVVLGLYLLVVPALVVVHLLLLAVPAAADGRGVGAALREGRRLVRDQGSLGFTAAVVGIWIGVLIWNAIVTGIAGVLVGGSDVALIAIGGVVELVFGPVLPLYVAFAYLDARAADEGEVPVDGGEAEEVGRADDGWRTVRCGACGAVVAVGPDDGDRVRCPTCDRTLRVPPAA